MTLVKGPSFLQRVKSAGMYAITGQWEGNERNRYRNRPYARKVSQDADLNLGVREDLMAEARALSQTVPIVKRILRQYANYVVGDCKIQFDTTDDAWNTQAEEQFNAWAMLCDYRSLHPLPEMARIAVVSELRDGDHFINEIDDDDFYFLEEIEADRVTNAKGTINIDEKNIVGGVKIGAKGNKLAFIVCDRQNSNGFQTGIYVNPRSIPSSQMIHYLDTLRADAYRGVTSFETVLNRIRSLKETLNAEQTAQGIASKLALLVKNNQGAKYPGAGVNLDYETTSRGEVKAVEEVADGVIKYMFPNEDIEAFHSARPGDSWFNLSLFFIREISIGLDLPFEFVWNMAGLAGTATRLTSQQAARTFGNKQAVLKRRFLKPIATRWVLKEMDTGRLPFHPEFTRFHFQDPPHPSVDVGRESQADIAELDAGLNHEDNLASVAGHDGGDVRRKRKQIVKEKFAHALEIQKEMAEQGQKVGLEFVLNMLGRPNAGKTSGSENEGESSKRALDAFGVGVRAGTITPTVDDENHFRGLVGLPPLSADAKASWSKEKNVRRPITLTQPDGGRAAPVPAGKSEDGDDE